MESFDRYLRGLRQRRRLTLGQLSLFSGVHKATLSRWESGTHAPRIPELQRVLDALHVSAAERARAIRLLDVPRALFLERRDSPADARLALGDLLYGLRQRAGKTQQDVARETGVSRSLYAQWESDAGRPCAEQLHAVGFALGASAREIVRLTTGEFAERPLDRTRDGLMCAYTETMEWEMSPEIYTLFLYSLLAGFGNLIRRDRADIGDMAVVVAKFGSCAELWHDDLNLRDAYNRRAIALASRSSRPLHFHLIPALEDNPRAALQWQPRFTDRAGQAYLLSFIARDIAKEDPDHAIRLSDTYCELVADHPDEYPCRLRDRGNLLRDCGRPAESVAFISTLEPPDEFRAGLNQLNLARGLVALEARAEAHACLDASKRILEPMNLQHVQGAIRELEFALA